MTIEILVARSIRTGRAVTIRYACHHLKSIFWSVRFYTFPWPDVLALNIIDNPEDRLPFLAAIFGLTRPMLVAMTNNPMIPETLQAAIDLLLARLGKIRGARPSFFETRQLIGTAGLAVRNSNSRRRSTIIRSRERTNPGGWHRRGPRRGALASRR